MKRKTITITLPLECLDWLDKQVKSRKYDTRSHGVELLILEKIRGEGTNKNEQLQH